MNIERRIEALEKRHGLTDRLEVIIRRLVTPSPDGPVLMEPGTYISYPGGWRCDREPGESAEAFLERAKRTVPHSPQMIPRLMEVE
jgi:hypothetical protein